MKFGERLSSTLIPEWRQHYLDYDAFKKILEEHVNDPERLLPVNDTMEAAGSNWNRNNFSKEFCSKLQASIDQVEAFYQQKCVEYRLMWNTIVTLLGTDSTPELTASMHPELEEGEGAVLGSNIVANVYEEQKQDVQRKHANTHVHSKSLVSNMQKCANKQKKQYYHAQLTKLELKDVEANIFELYKSVRMLKEFTSLNESGFIKIAKKHDKMFPTSAICTNRIKELLIKAKFASQSALGQFEDEIERVYGKYYDTKGKGAKKVLVSYCTPMGDLSRQRENLALHTGISLGVFIPIALVLMNMVINLTFTGDYTITAPQICRHMTRFHAGMIIYSLSLATVFSIYEAKRINYVLILELPSANMAAGANTIALRALWFATVHCFSIIMGITSSIISLEGDGANNYTMVPYPFGEYLSMLARLLPYEVWLCIPFVLYLVWFIRAALFPKRNKLSRYCLMVFLRSMNPRVRRINFPQFFFMDQAVSMNTLITDLCYFISGGYMPDYITACFLTTFNIVRAMQCGRRYKESGHAYPNIHNMMKYIVSIPGCFASVAVFVNIPWLRYTLYGIRCVETIYKIYWDTIEDWALFTGGAGALLFQQNNSDRRVSRSKILRRPSLFSVPTLYICSILNAIIRLYVPAALFITHPTFKVFWISSIGGLLEVFRRNLWNIFRLDNQQATNCEGYVVSHFIPLLESREERDKRNFDNRRHNREK